MVCWAISFSDKGGDDGEFGGSFLLPLLLLVAADEDDFLASFDAVLLVLLFGLAVLLSGDSSFSDNGIFSASGDDDSIVFFI